MKTHNHPSQPVELIDGVIRFKRNKIVDWMLDTGMQRNLFDLNSISSMTQKGMFDMDDYDQLMQLIGYSVSGYWDLSCSNKDRARRAQKKGMKLVEERE